jgi:hypothetical protein
VAESLTDSGVTDHCAILIFGDHENRTGICVCANTIEAHARSNSKHTELAEEVLNHFESSCPSDTGEGNGEFTQT